MQIILFFMCAISPYPYSFIIIMTSDILKLFSSFTGDISLQTGVTLDSTSNFNGPNPQFTLTCISTGGPATTVTWTRDFTTTVTEGTETVLDDPVTAQYTHTLTVIGRKNAEGIYTCQVSNNRPTVVFANYTIEGIQYYDQY